MSYLPSSQTLVNGTQTGGNCGSTWTNLELSDDIRCSYREVDRSAPDQIGVVILPDGTDVNGWAVSGCSQDGTPHDELDDPADWNDGDTTCRQGNTNGNRVGVTLVNPTWTDASDVDDFTVVSSAVVKKVSSSSASIAIDVKVGSPSYNNGATQTTTTSYVRYSRTDLTNPISAAEWTSTNINDLKIATRCVDCSPNNQATQVQAKVDAFYNAEHALEVRFAWSGVPVSGDPLILSVECQRLNPGAENVLVQVGQGGNPPSSWNTAYTCSSDSDQPFATYSLGLAERNGGAPLVRLWDNQADTPDDTVQGTMHLDVLRIDSQGEPNGGGPAHPAPPEVKVLPPTPPFANLVVTLLHPDRDAVQVGFSLGFFVVVENFGFRYANDTTVALFDGVNPAVLIGETNVVLEDFRGSAGFSWIASGLGSHTIRAVADPWGDHEETNETDNERNVAVLVTPGPPIGRPDLRVQSIDINPTSDPIANVSASVNVTVRNIGNAAAANVVVEVWEQERDLKVANYTIGSASAGAPDTHAISWTPDGVGSRHLEVRVDPYGAIAEHNESDNTAIEGFFVRPAGTFQDCTNDGICPAAPPPPNPCWYRVLGDLTIPPGRTLALVSCSLWVFGNVFVEGTLTFEDSTLLLFAFSNNQYRFDVRSGGVSSFAGSVLTPFRSSYGISARALSGSQFIFQMGSYARWLYGSSDPPVPGGLQLYSSNVLVQGSTVIAGQGHGLYVAPNVNAGVVSGNLLDGNKGAGIVVSPGAVATIQSNTLSSNRFGLYVNDASPTIGGNTIRLNFYGLFFYYRSSATLSGNEIQRNENGIWLSNGWNRPVPTFANVDVLNTTRFGIYSLLSNLTLSDSTVFTDIAVLPQGGGVGVVVDFLTYTSPGVVPRIVDNTVGSYHDYFLVIRKTAGGNVSNNLFATTRRGTWIMESPSVVVRNNTWRDAGGPGCGEVNVCDFFIDWRASSELFANHFNPGGGFGIHAVRSIASTTTVSGDAFERAAARLGRGLIAQQGSSIRVENATFNETANPILFEGGSAGLVAYNRMWRAPTYSQGGNSGEGIRIEDSNLPTIVLNNTIENYKFHVTFQNASSAGNLVEWNVLRAPYYPPGFAWNADDPNATADRCLVCVYLNSSATIRDNDMSGGAWGVSLDDRETIDGVPVLHWRNNYALVERNGIDLTGYVAVGVDTTSRADIRDNWINGSSGWAVFVESAFAGNRVERNRLNDTYGFAGSEGCNGSTILLASESGAPTLGDVTVSWNEVLRTNGTGLRMCRAAYLNSVYAHNNTVVDDRLPGGGPDAGITVHAASGNNLRLENNTVAGFLLGGVWVKSTPMDANHDFSRNILRGNTDGVRVGYGDTPGCPPRSEPYSLNLVEATFRDNVIEDNDVGVNASAWHETVTCSDTQGTYPAVALHVGRVVLGGNWIGNHTQDGIRVRSYVTNSTLPLDQPWVNATRNRIANNSHGVHLQGSSATYSVWADLHDNNTVGSFGGVPGNAYGVWIDAGTVDLTKFRAWWNDVKDNANQGIHVTGDPPGPEWFHAECNWWNDAQGPNDPLPGNPDTNPNPGGQPVSDYFHYKADGLGGQYWWLNSGAAQDTSCAL